MTEPAREEARQLVNGERFQADFALLQAYILTEFPAVSARALTRTAGDLDEVIALIAHETLHTRTFVRRRLAQVSRDVEDKEQKALRAHREGLVAESHRRRHIVLSLVVGLGTIVGLAVLALVMAPRLPEPVRGPLLATRRRIPELSSAARDLAVEWFEHVPDWTSAARAGASDLWDRRPWA